jgi:hypothetical protein
MKFNSPTDVEFDSSGNMYVACMGSSNRWTQGSGTEVRKFDPGNQQLWELLGLVYVDNADPVPGTDGTEIYTQTRRMTVDYTKPIGQQWTYAGYTFDPFTYPTDARGIQNQPSSAQVRIIGGRKIMYITSMNADWVALYRFQAGSEIAIPCGLLRRETDRGKPGNTFYIWVDADGNGAVDAGEVDTTLAPRSEVWGFTIDQNGGVWGADKATDKVRYYPCKGLNAIGAPTYGANYAGTSEREWPVPSEFVGGTTVYPLRAVYAAERDELFIGGYRVGREEQRWNWKAVGSCLGRYTGWLAGVQTRQWLIDIPYDPTTAYNGDTNNGAGATACMSVAGDYVFTVFMPTLGVSVFNRWTGAYVETLDAGPEICGNQALLDIVNGLSAMRRANGEYTMWMEDDGAQKVNMYRWSPAENPSIAVEQPAGTILTAGANVDFGGAAVGQVIVKTFTLRNNGTTSLFGLNLSKGGAQAAEFSASALVTDTLAPGETVTFNVTLTPSTTGALSAALHLVSNDPTHGTFDINLIGSGLSNREAWRQTYFQSTRNSGNAADDADPDGDHLSNLIEFACHLDPLRSDPLPGAVTLNGANMEFVYTRADAALAEGVTFNVRWSDTLAADSWSAAGVTETVLSDDGTTQQVKAVIPRDVAMRRFVHLSVMAPP